jgi:acyl-CoA thioesterase FadM
VPLYRLPVSHRPERDGTAVTSRHVTYYLALEVAALAWARLLDERGQGLLTAANLALVSTQFEFRRELFTGYVDVDVEVVRVGTSSVAFAQQIYQDDVRAATGETVVAQTNEARTRATPLSAEQRAMLGSLVRV